LAGSIFALADSALQHADAKPRLTTLLREQGALDQWVAQCEAGRTASG